MSNKEGFYEMAVKWPERGDTSKHVHFLGLAARLDFRRSLVSGLPSPRRDGWTRELQTMSVT